jgi:hypothetical protein
MNREFTSYEMAGHVFPKAYSIPEHDAPPLAKGVIESVRRLLITSSSAKQIIPTLHMTAIPLPSQAPFPHTSCFPSANHLLNHLTA